MSKFAIGLDFLDQPDSQEPLCLMVIKDNEHFNDDPSRGDDGDLVESLSVREGFNIKVNHNSSMLNIKTGGEPNPAQSRIIEVHMTQRSSSSQDESGHMLEAQIGVGFNYNTQSGEPPVVTDPICMQLRKNRRLLEEADENDTIKLLRPRPHKPYKLETREFKIDVSFKTPSNSIALEIETTGKRSYKPKTRNP